MNQCLFRWLYSLRRSDSTSEKEFDFGHSTRDWELFQAGAPEMVRSMSVARDCAKFQLLLDGIAIDIT